MLISVKSEYFVVAQNTIYMSRKDEIYNEEVCRELAKQCKTRGKFAKEYPVACRKAKKRGWYDTYDFFEKPERKITYTKEKCYECALLCKTKTEYSRRFAQAYIISKKNDYIKDYTWFERHYHRKYAEMSNDKIVDMLKEYSSRSEVHDKNHGLYTYCRKNKLFDKLNILPNKGLQRDKDVIDYVYAYIFKDYNAVYVGRTIDKKRRDWYHRNGKKQSSVKAFAIEHHCDIPEPIYLEENVTLDKGLEMEDYWVEKFRAEGYEILNRATTGIGSGSLGGIMATYTKKQCFEIAKSCSSWVQFRNEFKTAYYRVIRHRNWYEELVNELPYSKVVHKNYSYEEMGELVKHYKFFKDVPETLRNYISQHGWEYEWLKKLNKKAVIVYDAKGDFVNVFEKEKDAAAFLGISHSHISSVCNG